jgi:hypothetical protein
MMFLDTRWTIRPLPERGHRKDPSGARLATISPQSNAVRSRGYRDRLDQDYLRAGTLTSGFGRISRWHVRSVVGFRPGQSM